MAARQIQADRPDLFLEDHRIKLEPGCYTEVCKQGCNDIKEPFYLEGRECDDVTVTNSESDWISSYFGPIVCMDDLSGSEFILSSVDVTPEDRCKIKINPEVPDDGRAYYLIARCQMDIDEDIDAGNLPAAVCKHIVAFTNLVYFFAYGMDSMVNIDQSQSQQYFENYLRLMELSFFNDLSFREKNVVLGRLLDKSFFVGAE